MQQVIEIGGYIEFDFNKGNSQYHKNCISLNLARNCIRYLIENYNIQAIWVPVYTCPVVWQTIQKTNCKINFYHIDENFMPDRAFDKNDFILYTNYFGVCSKAIEKLSKNYPNLIIDNAQGFYMKPMGFASVYSPRKFFGVPDGGFLYCNKTSDIDLIQDKHSYSRCSHLLKRLENGSEFGYEDFNINEELLCQEPVKKMSSLTNKILNGINYKEARLKRLNNFKYLNKKLKKYNELMLNTVDAAMYYPFLIKNSDLRKNFIDNKIYIPQCWRGLYSNTTEKNELQNNNFELSDWERYLVNYLHPLIIDQRYGVSEMNRIVEVINNNL